jgi:hypothetical protein
MLELYLQGKIPYSSTRARWKFSKQGRLVAKQEGHAELCLRYICFILVGFFYMPQLCDMGHDMTL